MTKKFRIKCELQISADFELTREQINQYFKDVDKEKTPELWSEDEVLQNLNDWDYAASLTAVCDQIGEGGYGIDIDDLDGPNCEIVEE